jgi:glycine/D-amino acid oxidase-like deaminating enzyme/nitrite reductase/ring-hydroxylating ferredoxin subunit
MAAVWHVANIKEEDYPSLRENIETDVAVIGGGITGLTVALQLAEAGKRVVVLEARRIGEGNTGNSTGNLYSTVAKGLHSIREKWGDEAIKDVVRSRAEAIDLMESLVERFNIDCQFYRRPLYRILTNDAPEALQSLDRERDALRCSGLNTSEVENSLFSNAVHRGLKVEGQAQFNPLRYTQGLAGAASELGATIHEHSPVRKIDYDRNLLKTDAAEIQARHIVHATHTPKGVNLLQTGMEPAREYGVSARIDNSPLPKGIVWVLDPFHSLRSYHYNGQEYLVAVGEKHKVGGGTLGQGYYDRLRDYLKEHFQVQAFEHQWSAQQFSSADGLPYIGKMRGADNAYVATGLAADGLTWGTLAGTIISDLIRGRDNPWSERFDAKRFTPGKSLKGWMKENAHVTKHLVSDYLNPERIKELDEVKAGEGKVVSLDGEKLAVYRDNAGQFSVVSAVCPHMKCIVHWNAADTTWDCPCHGSRFGKDGAVIEGPAFGPLEARTRPPK